MNEPLKIGLAGLGTVGCGVIRMLDQSNGEDISRKLGRPIKVTAFARGTKIKIAALILAASPGSTHQKNLPSQAILMCMSS